MAQTTNGIILTNPQLGSQTIYGADRDIPEKYGYTQARVDGSDSFYIVYDKVDYLQDWPKVKNSAEDSVIVDKQSDINLKFVVRSLQGWDKTGITLFEHHYYCGTGATFLSSNVDINQELPTGNSKGASSFIVKKGIWALYTEKNYKGTQIAIEGQNEFGPDTHIPNLYQYGLGDRIQSVKYLREK